jgi:hypothetical protein
MSVIDIKASQISIYNGRDGWGSDYDFPFGYDWRVQKFMSEGEGADSFRVPQLKIDANNLFAIATVSSVKLYFYVTTNVLSQSYHNLFAIVSNTNHVSDTVAGTNYNELSAGTGWKYIDITSLYAALETPASDWYITLSGNSDLFTEPQQYAYFFSSGITDYEPYIHVDFTAVPSACTAPTAVSVDNAVPAPDAEVTLSWSGAGPGDWNTIVGYEIHRATNSAGPYSYLKEIATTNTYGSTTVSAPSVPGTSYYFKVITKGSEEGFDSGLSSQYAQVTATTTDCVAPSALSLSALVASTKPLLSWGGAFPGIGNAITGYEIEYSESADNATWGAWTFYRTLATTATSGASLVPIAETLGYYRRYRVKTLGTLEGHDSEWSAASESVRTSSSTVSQIQTPLMIVYEYPHIVFDDPDYIEKGPFPIGLVQLYNTLIWHPKYQGLGFFSLNMPFNETDNALLKCYETDINGVKRFRLIGKAGHNELMLILYKRIAKDKNGVEMIEVKGVSFPAVLAKRIVTHSAQIEDYPVGQIKSLLRSQPIFLEHYDEGEEEWVDDINGDMMADSYGDRRFPDFHWKEPAFTYETSPVIAYQPEKLAILLDEIIAMCKIEGCGFRATSSYYTDVADTLTNWFELYKGVDRSVSQDTYPHVIFDEKLGNIRSMVYTNSIENVKTAGYTTNLDIDELAVSSLRLVDIMSDNAYSAGDQAYINDGTPTANVNGGSGMSRDELGIVVSEIVAPETGTTEEKLNVLYNSCRQAGRNEINKSVEEHTFEVEINLSVGRQFGSDYFMGDIVTVRCDRYGVSMDARIAEAPETYETGKDAQISLIFGDPAITLLNRIKQISRRRG